MTHNPHPTPHAAGAEQAERLAAMAERIMIVLTDPLDDAIGMHPEAKELYMRAVKAAAEIDGDLFSAKTFAQCLTAARTAWLAARLAELVESVRGEGPASCPCLYGDPCSQHCSCAYPFMSGGCERCCAYGIAEQRAEHARELIAKIDGRPTV